MVQYSNVERFQMIIILGECRGNSRAAARLYAERYPQGRHPTAVVIYRTAQTLKKHGKYVRARPVGWNRVATTPYHEQEVVEFVTDHPHASCRSIADDLQMSATSVWRILKRHKFHPYHMHLHQELHGNDNQRRTEFCVSILAVINDNPRFLHNIMFSDESTFHNDGTVNRHNMHYWSLENPRWLRFGNFQARFKVNVWCGIFGNRIVGPYFFDETLTAARYLQFLQNDLVDELPLDFTNVWFQQDGAPPHYGREVTAWLNTTFPRRWIGRGGPVPWPARSPDLTPLDFFLWGFLKSKVYETQPMNVADLKNKIQGAVAMVTPTMLKQVRRALKERCNDCLTGDGLHFEHQYD